MQGFLARNGQPYHHLDPDIDEVARALIEHFHVTEAELPIVVCPDGQLCGILPSVSWRAISVWSLGSIRIGSMT